jgi:hypothetical protein
MLKGILNVGISGKIFSCPLVRKNFDKLQLKQAKDLKKKVMESVTCVFSLRL